MYGEEAGEVCALLAPREVMAQQEMIAMLRRVEP